MPNAQLTPGGILFACIVGWWIFASASLRTIEFIQALKKMLRGE